jgi:asparagine synthase (glutamine-hydrolysing)
VGIASKLQGKNTGVPFRTYAAVSNNQGNCIESRFIRMMIDQGQLDPVLVSPSTVKDYSSAFSHTSELMEDPFDDSWTMLRLIYLTAREHGSVAVMDGVDGDLITGLSTSYPSYLLRQGEIKRGLHEINAQRITDFEGETGRLIAYAQAIRPAITPNWLRRLKASSRTSNSTKTYLKDAMLSKSFINRVNFDARWDEYCGQSTLGYCPSLRHAHAERLVAPYLTAAIERYNRIASYCAVEARQPFHDKRVIEHCLSLPWQQKAQNGWMKYGLRNVLQRVAPAEVAWRTEFDSIMWKFGAAWNKLNQQQNIALISSQRERLSAVVEQDQLDKMLSRYVSGDAEAEEPIWNVVTLLNWLRANQLEI